MPGKLFVKRGREKPLKNHHPWIFSGAIDRVMDASEDTLVEVYDAEGKWLARAAYNARSQIAARVWTFNQDEQIESRFFHSMLSASIARREGIASPKGGETATSAFRLVNAESDGLPGLIVDRYGDFTVAQFLTAGVESYKTEITDELEGLLKPRGIYERSDVDVRKKEGLSPIKGPLRGEDPPDRIMILENGIRFWVDVKSGQKTGFYLDQRENRKRAYPYLKGEVLNTFAYSGGFGVYAAKCGAAKVMNIDASSSSLELARDNYALDGVESNAQFVIGDAFEELRALRADRRRFDAIVLDPPKFVSSQNQMERGLRGYKDINMLAFQLVRSGGVLVTFSCSGLVTAGLFQQVVFEAMRDADREGQIVERLAQGADHPIALTFPEAEYLTGLIVRVI